MNQKRTILLVAVAAPAIATAVAVTFFGDKTDPSRAVAYLNLGDAYAKSSNTEKAKKAFSTYLELAPNGSSAPYARQQLDKI